MRQLRHGDSYTSDGLHSSSRRASFVSLTREVVGDTRSAECVDGTTADKFKSSCRAFEKEGSLEMNFNLENYSQVRLG